MHKTSIFLLSILLLVRPLPASAGTIARFKTDAGVMLVELFDNEKPVTVNNFINLTKMGAYRYTFFHRVVPGFIIQGGGYWRIDNSYYSLNFPSITNEYNVGQHYSNNYGTIAMAKTPGQVDSATSEWFFNLADNLELDTQNGGFTVFGRVVHGLNVLEYFNNTNNYCILTNAINVYFSKELPTQSTNNPPTANDIFFTDISIISITNMVTNPDGSRTIDWPNAIGVTNYIQAVTNISDNTWLTLATTNSNRDDCRFTDTNTLSGTRFYRISINASEPQ